MINNNQVRTKIDALLILLKAQTFNLGQLINRHKNLLLYQKDK